MNANNSSKVTQLPQLLPKQKETIYKGEAGEEASTIKNKSADTNKNIK